MIVVRPVSDETGHAEDADQGEDGAAAPGRDRDPRHQDDRVDDGLDDRRCFLSDRGDDENVDDQQDEQGAETPFTGSSSSGYGICRKPSRQTCFFSVCQGVSFVSRERRDVRSVRRLSRRRVESPTTVCESPAPAGLRRAVVVLERRREAA